MTNLTEAVRAIDWWAILTAPWAPYVYAAMCLWVAMRQVQSMRATSDDRRLRAHLARANDPARQRAIGRP